jgi:glycosyltransferase involved in cell wall biosynthesis
VDLVSAICLTSNPQRADMLSDAVKAYRWQTHPAKELVIVNDGRPLTSKATDIRVVNLRELEPGRTSWSIGEKRNAGVRVARGTWLATWDDDDVSLPDRLELQVKYATITNADMVLSNAMWILTGDLDPVGRCDRGQGQPTQASALIRRSCVVAAGGYKPVNYLEDFEMLERIRYICRGHVVQMPDADFYLMRRHGLSASVAAGEKDRDYVACALKDPARGRLDEDLRRLRAAPGGDEVVGS